MTPEMLIDTVQHTLWMMGLLSAPVLLTSLVLGVGIGVFQVVTSLQEQTLAFVPKLLAALLVLALTLPWMLSSMVDYGRHMFNQLEKLG
jgi:flagellar biosynthesis protein FliQ